MALASFKNKIFPILLLLLAVTLNSFSGAKRIVVAELLSISTRNTDSNHDNSSDTEIPQSTEEQESDDKAEDVDDPFIVEYFNTTYINHQVNDIHEFQIALYHEFHQVIFSPPPEA